MAELVMKDENATIVSNKKNIKQSAVLDYGNKSGTTAKSKVASVAG